MEGEHWVYCERTLVDKGEGRVEGWRVTEGGLNKQTHLKNNGEYCLKKQLGMTVINNEGV